MMYISSFNTHGMDTTCTFDNTCTCEQYPYFLRDRPFNFKGGLGFFLGQNIFLFFLEATRQIIFFEFNITLYSKNSVSDFFFLFLLSQINFFFATFVLKLFYFFKPPPLEVKWSVSKKSLG